MRSVFAVASPALTRWSSIPVEKPWASIIALVQPFRLSASNSRRGGGQDWGQRFAHASAMQRAPRVLVGSSKPRAAKRSTRIENKARGKRWSWQNCKNTAQRGGGGSRK